MRNKEAVKQKSALFFLFLPALIWFFIVCLSSPTLAVDDSVCARVKLEIRQELTLERQAFDAHMRITNGLSHITLEDVNVDVSFLDEEGNSVLASSDPENKDAIFFIRLDSLENIDNVSGTGSVEPVATADIHWLIIPAPGASNGVPQGTLYYVGATLTYTIGGEGHITGVTPDYIFVKPLPELTLDYFLPADVYGDDAFTPEIEPPIPFYLGVRLKNNGSGIAKDMKINSAQPQIVDNEQGLLIGFVIEGCEVNGQAAAPSLLADLGDIEPNTSAVARWVMTCSLSGEFVEFTADYSHSDELGGELTSLLEAVNTHFLVQDVLVDVAGRDSIRDFLARDEDVYRVYESENIDTDVTDQSAASSLTGSGNDYTLSAPVTAGFMYAQLPDPHDGQKELKEIIRSDGKRIKPENAWLSKTRNEDHSWQHFLNLFDANTTGSYTVTFKDAAAIPHPPALQFIPDRTVVEEEQLSFLVEATDADGTYPNLDARPLPALASFIDQGDGTGIFNWTPAIGQAGQYRITFTASDGELEDSQRVVIRVNSVDDTDGDGMADAWEMEHFGTLDRDGTGDFDRDGISDLDEFLNSTDPTVSNQIPTIPVIQTPGPEAEVSSLQPELVIENSTDPDGDTLTYIFELYADEEMTVLEAEAFNVAEGVDTTSWAIPAELSDNTWYLWRVRATDGFSFTYWTYGSFFVNTENNPPGAFNISSPMDNSDVDTLTPVLQVTNSIDVDEDTLTYTFEIYADSAMGSLIVSASNILEGEDGSTSWVVDTPLDDDTWYYWQAVVTDEHGATAETPLASFLLNTQNAAPQALTISSPAPGSEVALQELDLVVTNARDTDGDALFYFFELDRVNTFDSTEKQTSGEISEGGDTTTWHVSGLDDNTLYYWRVKASDRTAESTWAQGSFFVNTENDPPSTPTLRNPGHSAWVDTPTPTLKLNPAIDPDHDSLTYLFEVYADPDLTSLVTQGESDTTRWTLPSALNDTTWYYWRAKATDEHDAASAWSSGASFFVKDNGVDDTPEIAILEPAEDLLTNGQYILITWEDSDPDSNANITLSYDTDSAGQDGTLIAEGLKEDLDGVRDTFLWDITTIPDGTYYIYATITDGTSTNNGYSPGSVTIYRTPPTVIITPQGGTYTSAQTVTLSTDEPAQIYFTTDGTEPSSSSMLYTSPIEITETTTLKVTALDAAGNQSDVITVDYTIQQEITVTVETSTGRRLAGLKVYAFTEAGSYTGKHATTDEDGIGFFSPQDLADGSYKFRVDHLGNQFWSEVVSIPDTYSVDVLIEEETVEVTVTTGSGPASGIKVYLFSESSSYLGVYEVTDADGKVCFDLPVGRDFTFRADILGTRYWSDVTTISGGGTNTVSVDAGGGLLQVTVHKAPGEPMEGIKTYLFNQSGTYLGLNQVTDSSGIVEFSVSEGTYKVRVDYLGYKFWSEETPVIEDTTIEIPIAHYETQITVAGVFQATPDPIEGIKVYLFSPTGSYLGKNQRTDDTGKVLFDLPEKPYKVRADYLGQQFWSDAFTWENVTIGIPMADVEITVTGAGFPQEGVKVYVFSSKGSYLGLYETTDSEGKVTFRLPEGPYKFRADYQGSRFWSAEETLTADQLNPIIISVGGGSFTLTVLKGAAEPLVGVKCYVFSEAGSYLGMSGATNGDGEVSFDLADGSYKFRVDHLGNQFWSEVVSIPDTYSVDVLIEEETVEVTVTTGSGPASGIKVYLFSESSSYLGVYEVTDADGKVCFDLPVGRDFTFRADILGTRYWSDVTTISGGGTNTVSVDAGGGLLQVTVHKAPGEPMEGIKTYLFNQSGTYLGLNQVTDSSGIVEFSVSEGTYKVRVDYLGYKFWSEETPVIEDTTIEIPIAHYETQITVAGVFQATPDPIEGIKVYLFSPTGSYLGKNQRTDDTGKVLFDLPEKPYKVRADYLGQQFWSETFQSQETAVTIQQGLADIHVHRSGVDVEGAKVYLFTGGGSYLRRYERTDSSGKAEFLLPDTPYKFRVDEGGYRYWSPVIDIIAGAVNGVEVDTD